MCRSIAPILEPWSSADRDELADVCRFLLEDDPTSAPPAARPAPAGQPAISGVAASGQLSCPAPQLSASSGSPLASCPASPQAYAVHLQAHAVDLREHARAMPASPFVQAAAQRAAGSRLAAEPEHALHLSTHPGPALKRVVMLHHAATTPSPFTRSASASSCALSWVAAFSCLAEEQGCAVPAPFGGTWRGLDASSLSLRPSSGATPASSSSNLRGASLAPLSSGPTSPSTDVTLDAPPSRKRSAADFGRWTSAAQPASRPRTFLPQTTTHTLAQTIGSNWLF